MSAAAGRAWGEVAMAEAEKAFRLEIESAAVLSSRAEKYVAAAALAAGLPIFGPMSGTRLAAMTAADRAVLAAGASLFAAGILLALAASRTHRYKSYPPDRKMLDILERAASGEIGVHLQMAAIYLDARASNRKVNARRATLLGWSLIALITGFASFLGLSVRQFLF